MDRGWPRITDSRGHYAHPLKHGGGRAGKHRELAQGHMGRRRRRRLDLFARPTGFAAGYAKPGTLLVRAGTAVHEASGQLDGTVLGPAAA